MISRLLCWWKGHRRGKFLRAEDNGNARRFSVCPRCKREKRYEVKAA
jgi:hypothetical protein